MRRMFAATVVALLMLLCITALEQGQISGLQAQVSVLQQHHVTPEQATGLTPQQLGSMQAAAGGFHTRYCPSSPGVANGTAEACLKMTGLFDSDHGLDIYTGQNSTKALCMYDYLGNPGLCLTTLGGAVETFGRTIRGSFDGDSLTSFGNRNVFVPTNRVLANGGMVTDKLIICPPGHLVDMSGCVTFTASDVRWLHSHGG